MDPQLDPGLGEIVRRVLSVLRDVFNIAERFGTLLKKILIEPTGQHLPSALPLSETQSQTVLAEAFVYWALRHPDPDSSLVGTAEGEMFTARELASEVIGRTPIGLLQLHALQALADRDPERGIDELVRRLRQRADRQGPAQEPPSATF